MKKATGIIITPEMIDKYLKEYRLIREKKSKLSAMQRFNVIEMIKMLHRKGFIVQRNEETVKAEPIESSSGQ